MELLERGVRQYIGVYIRSSLTETSHPNISRTSRVVHRTGERPAFQCCTGPGRGRCFECKGSGVGVDTEIRGQSREHACDQMWYFAVPCGN